jgi:hypothetical protein
MFLTLLLATLSLAILVSVLVALFFRQPLHRILDRLVAGDLSAAWLRYLLFAVVVVGVGGGVRLGSLARYIEPTPQDQAPLVLNGDRWTLELYQTLIGSLQSIAWMLLIFFVFALIAYVIVRGLEMRAGRSSGTPGEGSASHAPGDV